MGARRPRCRMRRRGPGARPTRVRPSSVRAVSSFNLRVRCRGRRRLPLAPKQKRFSFPRAPPEPHLQAPWRPPASRERFCFVTSFAALWPSRARRWPARVFLFPATGRVAQTRHTAGGRLKPTDGGPQAERPGTWATEAPALVNYRVAFGEKRPRSSAQAVCMDVAHSK